VFLHIVVPNLGNTKPAKEKEDIPRNTLKKVLLKLKEKLKNIGVEGGEIMEDNVLILILSSHSGGKLMSLNT